MTFKPAGRRLRNSSMSSLPKTANKRVSNASSTPGMFGIKSFKHLKGQYKGLEQIRPMKTNQICTNLGIAMTNFQTSILIEPYGPPVALNTSLRWPS